MAFFETCGDFKEKLCWVNQWSTGITEGRWHRPLTAHTPQMRQRKLKMSNSGIRQSPSPPLCHPDSAQRRSRCINAFFLPVTLIPSSSTWPWYLSFQLGFVPEGHTATFPELWGKFWLYQVLGMLLAEKTPRAVKAHLGNSHLLKQIWAYLRWYLEKLYCYASKYNMKYLHDIKFKVLLLTTVPSLSPSLHTTPKSELECLK